MIRQAEISSFLDLIKHISERKERYSNKNLNPSHNSRNSEQIRGNAQRERNSFDWDRDSDKFQHKMLKYSHVLKKKPKSFKMDQIPIIRPSEEQMQENQMQENQKSNLFSAYCQELKRKRAQKKKDPSSISRNQSIPQVYDIAETVNFRNSFDHEVKESSMPSIGGSKTLKNGLEPCKKQKIKVKKIEWKKKQPIQLNIETFGTVKMPRISQHTHIGSTLGNDTRLNIRMKMQKKAVINKLGEIAGWANEDEDKHDFIVDIL